MKCDFCNDEHPRWEYPAADFDDGISGSGGGWAACDACHALIERGDRVGVTVRSVEKITENPLAVALAAACGESVHDFVLALAPHLVAVHLGFFESRTAPARPIALV